MKTIKVTQLKSSAHRLPNHKLCLNSGFKYHGRIKALADAARENGLEF